MMLRKSLALLVLLQSAIAFVAPSMQPSHRASTWLAEGEGGDSTDILNSPSFLQRKLEVLKSDIEQAEKDLEEAQALAAAGKEEWKPQLDDLRKEFQNIQERMASQGEGKNDQATLKVAREMLSVLDNYDRAFGAVTAETDADKAVEAEYQGTYDLILSTLEELGVEEVPTVGTEFDYEIHQAVMQKPTDEFEEGFVCEEFQKGFKIGSSLVRAAMVAVAA